MVWMQKNPIVSRDDYLSNKFTKVPGQCPAIPAGVTSAIASYGYQMLIPPCTDSSLCHKQVQYEIDLITYFTTHIYPFAVAYVG
jgi:hypothetical protein